jgi:hypothetical protein
MKQVVLDLRSLKVSDKVNLGRLVAESLDENDDFPDSAPHVAKTNTATDELQAAYAEAESARSTAKEKTAALKKKAKEYDNVMNEVANYVEITSKGDEVKIKSAGLKVKTRGVRSKDHLPAPKYLSTKSGNGDGEIILKWSKVKGSVNYRIEISTNPSDETKWQHKKFSTKLKTSIGGLVSGQRYWFHVSAINTNGEGPFSDQKDRIAP